MPSDRLVFHGDDFSHQVASSFGYHVTDNWAVFGNLAYSDSALSDQKYVSPDGAVERDLRGNQTNRPLELNLGLGSKDSEVRVTYYRYQARDQIFYGMGTTVVPQGQPGATETSTLASSAKRHFKVSDRLSITPRALYRFEIPWDLNYNGTQDAAHRRYQRLDLDMPATIEIGDWSKMVLGVHYYREYVRAVLVSGTNLNYPDQTVANYFSGSDHIAHDDVAAYAQYDLDTKWVNLTLGGRYEYYGYPGGTFVPRVGLVKAWDRFHVKALYSQSFRTPNIGVVNDSPVRLKDEFTTTYEVEAGVRLNGTLSLTGNAYHVRIENLIGYEAIVNRYDNGPPMSTEGVELQARFNSEKLTAHLGYSYNRAVDQGFDLYSASPTLGHLNLNMPAHQIVWSANWHITKALNWSTSGTFLDRRAAYASPDPTAPSLLKAEVLLHTYLGYQWRQFDLGLGVRDLFNVKETIGQPYNGGSGPLRLSGRTFFAQVGIRFHDDR